MRNRRRRAPVLSLLAMASAVAISLPIYALGAAGDDQYPDLQADPPENISGPEVAVNGLGAGRLLVRFDGFVTNLGKGPLELSGNPQIPQGQPGSVQQLARSAPGQAPSIPKGTPPVYYETADGHNHFHLQRVMRYSLWNSSKTAPVSPGQKVGFCLYDIQDAPAANPPQEGPAVYTQPVTLFCRQNEPGATKLRMGVSVGWRDVYDKSLSFQWVDVSDTPPGIYYVAAEADPDNLVWEGGGAAEAPSRAFATVPVTIPGWVAQPVGGTQTGSPQVITLASAKFGGQGDSSLRYTIVSGPGHGTLNVATGVTFSGNSVTYTPAPGYRGPDSFGYAAVYNGSGFPLNPPVATVSLTSTQPSIAISGAPAALVAGTGVQLTASTSNLSGGVAWSASAGTVSPTGLYIAPKAPPPGGVVTVTAASAADPSVSASVTIGVSPAPTSRPTPGVAGTGAGNKLLSRLTVRKATRRVFVARVTTGRRAGKVIMSASFRRKVVGRCVSRQPARRAVTCKFRLKRNYRLTRVRVTAKLSIRGKSVAVRRAYVVKPRRKATAG